MILTVSEARALLPDLNDSDEALELKLQGLTQLVKSVTNNDFERYRDPLTGDVAWPADLKLGVVNLLSWDAQNRDRLGVASETISRHSVTYAAMSAAEYTGGYPTALLTFTRPYERARF